MGALQMGDLAMFRVILCSFIGAMCLCTLLFNLGFDSDIQGHANAVMGCALIAVVLMGIAQYMLSAPAPVLVPLTAFVAAGTAMLFLIAPWFFGICGIVITALVFFAAADFGLGTEIESSDHAGRRLLALLLAVATPSAAILAIAYRGGAGIEVAVSLGISFAAAVLYRSSGRKPRPALA